MQVQNVFIHHVFFWLKNLNEEDRKELIKGLQKLSNVSTIKRFHIGKPAQTNRDVIENGYDVSWCLFFESAEHQESYQVDPIHLEFVETCSHLWKKVVVYDSVDINESV